MDVAIDLTIIRDRFERFLARTGTRNTYVLPVESVCTQCHQTFHGSLLLAVSPTGTEMAMGELLDDRCPRCRQEVVVRSK